ncbi:MAG: hypothetical protein OXD01_11435 [Gammaproteobacteria bacterium]|nr:hypothetical protein [Gammaproteobacteria bacterium]
MQRALTNQITHLAITDHNFITWEMNPDWGAEKLQLISGVEISAQWQQHEIHIVGLCIDPKDKALNQHLYQQRQTRRERIATVSRLLESNGINGFPNFQALPCKSWTCRHVAEFQVR